MPHLQAHLPLCLVWRFLIKVLVLYLYAKSVWKGHGTRVRPTKRSAGPVTLAANYGGNPTRYTTTQKFALRSIASLRSVAVDVITFSCYCLHRCCCCCRRRQMHVSSTTTQLKLQHNGPHFAQYLFYCFPSGTCTDLEDITVSRWYLVVLLLSVGYVLTLRNVLPGSS